MIQLSFSIAERLDGFVFDGLLNDFNGVIYQSVLNDDWSLTFLSGGCEKLTGYAPEEFIHHPSTSYQNIIVLEHQSYVHQKKLKAIQEKSKFTIEYRIRHKNNALIWVSEYGVPVFNSEGEVVMLQGYIQDMTQQKTLEESLRNAEIRYRSLFENSIEGIFQTSLEGKYLAVNKALATIYGYDNTQELVESLQDINNQLYVDPNRREQFVNEMETKGFVHNFESLVYKKDRTIIWLSENARKVYNEAGEFLYFEGTGVDITERKLHQGQIEYQSTHDSLTGLPNRYLLNDRLQQNIHHCQRYNTRMGVAFIDVDHFKKINDTMGHDVGDKLLVILADRISSSIRDVDTVARLGGDEFVVLIANVEDAHIPHGFETVIQRIRDAIATPVVIDELDYVVTSSIGLSIFPDHGDNPQSLLKNADIALYEAKRIGRNNCQFYNEELGSAQKGGLKIEQELRRALEGNEFLLHYQPKVCALTRQTIGAEALIRWQTPDGKMIPPFEFIDIAEQSGLIIKIGEWVLREACQQMCLWNKQFGLRLSVAVNVSALQFRQEGFVSVVESALTSSGLAPELLELEITESLAAHDVEGFLNKLNALKAIGLKLAIDDFGTGYSSLAYLKNFPIDCLKIDKSFVSKLEVEPLNQAIVKAIIVLGQSLNMHIVAEGVETEFEKQVLDGLGCDIYQGYLFSKPLAGHAFEKLMSESMMST